MKNVLLAAILFNLIIGCSVQKQVNRQQVAASSQSETREEMASRLKKETKTDVTATMDQRVTETCDTSLQVPGSSLHGNKALADLLSDGYFKMESNEMEASVLVDTLSGKVTLSVIEKPRVIPHKFNRITETRVTTNKTINEEQDLKTTGSQQITTKSESESNLVVKDVRRSVSWWGIGIAILAGCLVFLIARKVRNRIL
jgi:uncharacterized protein (DUF608 family)